MNLYQINELIERAFESAVDPETGEIFDLVAYVELDKLEMMKEEKIENLLLWIKNLNAEAIAIKAEEKVLEGRRKCAERKAESLKEYVEKVLDGEKFATPKTSVSWRKSEVAEYTGDVRKLPECCIRYKEPEVSKSELKKLLKGGATIPGARLVTKNNMSIK